MSRPLNRMPPAVGCRNLVIRLKQVVLPAPFGPMSAWMVPRRTERLTFLTAQKPLKLLDRPAVSMIASLVLIALGRSAARLRSIARAGARGQRAGDAANRRFAF